MSRIFWRGDSIRLAIAGVLNARSLDAVLSEFPLTTHSPDEIVLDMTHVRHVKPGGVGQLVSFLSWFSSRGGAPTVPTTIVGLSEPVASFLATLGVFSILKRHAGLTDAEHLIDLEHQRRTRGQARDRMRPLGVQATQSAPAAVVMPMELIPKGTSTLSVTAKAEFEYQCNEFVNRAVDKFEHLFQAGFLGGILHPQQFWHANVELYKNVFEHSESWGLAIVFATPKPPTPGTVVSYHDWGIGIPASVARVLPSGTHDEAAIRWAIKERNTTRPGNDGLGLSIVADCVRTLQGRIEVRSGSCRLIGDGGDGGWIGQQVPRLPGTHISFFIPSSS